MRRLPRRQMPPPQPPRPFPPLRQAIQPQQTPRFDKVDCPQVPLGRVDISAQPDEGGHKMPEHQTAPAQLLKPREHPPVTLHFADKALHQVTLPVSIRVIHHLPVGTPRYHCRHPQLGNALPQPLRVAALVRNHIRSDVTGQQSFGLGNVVLLASRRDKTQGVARSVHGDRRFGAEPAPTAT